MSFDWLASGPLRLTGVGTTSPSHGRIKRLGIGFIGWLKLFALRRRADARRRPTDVRELSGHLYRDIGLPPPL